MQTIQTDVYVFVLLTYKGKVNLEDMTAHCAPGWNDLLYCGCVEVHV